MSDQNPEDLGTIADGNEIPMSLEDISQDPTPIDPEAEAAADLLGEDDE